MTAPPVVAGGAPPVVVGGDAAAGFTLIEVIVALVLFALIALAGVAMLDTILGVQHRTDGQLDRLGDLERAMFVVSRDFEAIADAPLVGSSGGVAFNRHAATGPAIVIRYDRVGTILRRSQNGRQQRMLDGVTALQWRYYAVGTGWQSRWPATDKQAQLWPAAVELDLTLAPTAGGLGGTLRRIVDLPARPLPPIAVTP